MRQQPQQSTPDSPQRLQVKSPQDLAGGIFLLVIAALGFLGSWNLTFGELGGVGSGMVPKAISAMVAAFAALLIARGFLSNDIATITPWSLRGLFFVLGAALLFAWTIRPLGLIFAAPVAIVFSSFADRTTRPLELALFTVALTAFCILLFSGLLRLPIPVLPSALPYPLNEYLQAAP